MWIYLQVWTLVFTILAPVLSGAAVVQPRKPDATVVSDSSSGSSALAQPRLVNISNRDMNLLRQDPSTPNLRAVYSRYKSTLDDVLPEWGLDDDGFSLIFATLVAYQAAPYGAEDGPVGTRKDMFALGQMECRGYSLFVAKLFRKLQLGNRWTVYLHGFDGAKFIGNHAQVIAVDNTSRKAGSTKKSGLVLDATVGVVAKVALDSLPLPAPASDVFVLGLRNDTDVSTVPELRTFRENVVKGLTSPGTYQYAKMIYQEDTSVFLGVGTVNPNLKTAIGVVGRTLYVMPDGEADTSRGVWQQFYTYNGYSLLPPYNPAIVPYRACDAPTSGRQGVCACFSNRTITAPLGDGGCWKKGSPAR